MSERKVLNKYYPPDFDPSKIPRMKCSKNRQFTVRLMAPFNMRCATCGEYIYKGKKFNAKKEDVEGEDYLGIRIFRFYIKCTRCLQEISFKTDPKNTDYEIEAGATRNFMALKLAEEQAEREEEERKEEEASNPMKLLENRTKQSKHELELLESLEELKDLNKRQQNIDYDNLLSQFSTKEAQERILKLQEEEDEKYIKTVFGKRTVVKEEIIDDKIIKKKKKSHKSLTQSEKDNNPLLEAVSNSRPAEVPSDSSSNAKSDKKDSLMSTVATPLKPLATDLVKGTSFGGLKHTMNNLIRIKASEGTSCISKNNASIENKKDTRSPNPQSTQPTALSMLGSYSGSDSDSS
uniref:Splicing factor YJU2 n=1 Tax=Triatoma dimidiata TaxID=72491 RepID=A0A0V0G6U1_TRIDM